MLPKLRIPCVISRPSHGFRASFLIFVLVFIFESVEGQQNPNVAAYRADLYVGKTLALKPTKDFGFQLLSKNDFGFNSKDYTLFKKDAYSYESDTNKVKNIKFECIGYETAINSDYKTNIALKLQYRENKICYYQYDPRLANITFAFIVEGGLDFPEDFYCQYISKDYDKFDNKNTYTSIDISPMEFIKTIVGQDTTYYLSLKVYDMALSAGKGVVVLLRDGSRLEWPEEKVDYKASPISSSKYMYSAFLRLSTADLTKLKNSDITDYKLHIFRMENINGHAEMEQLKCLLKM